MSLTSEAKSYSANRAKVESTNPTSVRRPAGPSKAVNLQSSSRASFGGERATFVFLGSTTLEGKKAFHFGYQVPLEQSVYSIRSNAGEAIVGYSGSLWVARDSLDLMRLVVSGDNLAARLWLTSVVTTTDYAQVPIGGKQFLLPVRSAYEAKDLFGSEDRNTTRFENCHEFIGESVLKFGDSDSLPSGK